MSNPKLCSDCKHYTRPTEPAAHMDLCLKALGDDGKPQPCVAARGYEELCGAKAKWWAKEPDK